MVVYSECLKEWTSIQDSSGKSEKEVPENNYSEDLLEYKLDD